MTTDAPRPSVRPPDIALFAGIDPAVVSELLWTLPVRTFATGEHLCHEGEPGSSMFILRRGLARVVIGPDQTSVRRLRRGDVVGEMSMLTGDPRTATVTALDDSTLLEITADRFRDLAVRRPGLVEDVSAVVSARRQGLAQAQAAADEARTNAPAPQSLLARIKTFLNI